VGLSTLEMTLTMKPQAFRSDMNIRQALMYSHERIDVNVSVGKGKELIPLGVASIIVSGEEEGEIVSNVPVKCAKQDNRNEKLGVKGYTKSFMDDPFVYCLDENTTLRIGLQVFPKQLQQKRRTESRDDYPAEKDESAILELNDENSLLEKPKAIEERDELNEVCTAKTTETMVPEEAQKGIFAGFLCEGIFECFDPSTEDGTLPNDTNSTNQQLMSRKTTTEAHILPLNQLSDVTSKTFETWELATDFGDATTTDAFMKNG